MGAAVYERCAAAAGERLAWRDEFCAVLAASWRRGETGDAGFVQLCRGGLVSTGQGAGVRDTAWEIGCGIECDIAAFADYELFAFAGGGYCFPGGSGVGHECDASRACGGGCVVAEGEIKRGVEYAGCCAAASILHTRIWLGDIDCLWYTFFMPM